MSCLVQCRKDLGRLLHLARQVELRPAPLVSEHAVMAEIAASFAGNGGSTLLYVVGEDGVLKGAISLADILRYLFFYQHDPYSPPATLRQLARTESAAGFMRRALSVRMTEEVVDVLEKMTAAALTECAVVDDNDRLLARLSMTDLVHYYRQVQNRCSDAPEEWLPPGVSGAAPTAPDSGRNP
ncbi:MAG: hypothetical protein C0613_11855 [Desulfobulbaceae bacterium]|nr:MAG: hypothetical protein C0613_11855 [Desulfobulbaceae bacterium]